MLLVDTPIVLLGSLARWKTWKMNKENVTNKYGKSNRENQVIFCNDNFVVREFFV